MTIGTNPDHIEYAKARLTDTYATIFANTGLSFPAIQDIAAEIKMEEVNAVLMNPHT